MQPNQPDNSVWISREEYERLRQIERSASIVNPVQLTMPVGQSATILTMQPDKDNTKTWQIAVGVIAGFGLYLSLTVPALRLIFIPVVGVVIIFTTISFYNFLRAGRHANSALAGHRTNPYKTLLIVLGCILLAPVLIYGAFIAIFILILSLGGGIG